jgi:DNA repair protein RecN (Recombination protein N)
MLKSLKIKDFAIIKDLNLEFYPGMTVLSGETGAGKSIIVDAISLLLGDRADKDMISSKSENATIIGEFKVSSKEIKSILLEQDIDIDGSLTISRIISKDKSNIIKINNQNSSLKTLKELAIYLADIHSQFDTNQLINPENYLSLVDNFRKTRINDFLISYQNRLDKYMERIKEHRQIIKQRDNTLKQLDLYKFQYNELNSLNLISGEDELLNENINVLQNIDKINTLLQKSSSYLNDELVLDKIYEIKADLEKIAHMSKDFESLHERLMNIYYELDDINHSINQRLDNLNYDKDDFEAMNQRLLELEKIQKKYQKSIDELIEYQNFLAREIDQVLNFKEVYQESKNLYAFRVDIAQKIKTELIDSLHELVIQNADFDILIDFSEPKDEFDYQVFTQTGCNQVEFLISTNKGEPLKPLSKTASGGEMSRVMLAFKTIFAKSQNIPTIIFDEIDTGISGFIAKQIAKKISDLSRITQVISITHIPQVVAEGIHHLAVNKHIINDSTEIRVKYLTHEERIEEIAKMVSGERITDAARDIARELLLNKN